MGTFADDTAVEPLGQARYGAEVTERWTVLGGVPNGGYLMAIAARAMAGEASHPDPVSVTGHFLRPTAVGPATVEVEVLKRGRRLSQVAARLVQEGDTRLQLLGAFADLEVLDGPTKLDRQPPALPPRGETVDANASADEHGTFAPPILRQLDVHMPAATLGWSLGQPDGTGEMRGWCRLADDEELDVFGLLMMADAFPPAVFNSGAPVGWTPTIEMTTQIRKRPAPGWLAGRFATGSITGGYLEEDGELWDEAGDVVCLSRQLALAARA
ncbi:MAG: thioesterase family protein [Actinobacteria bacterium]|nr:thioesterase family protein [Actinomycetota bacterium]